MDSGEYDNDRTRSSITLAPGARVSHYTIVRRIGAGGMGEVYLARDETLDREVALKFLPPDQAQDADRRERFQREALAVAKLSHPNIVHVYEVGEHQGRPFFAMEYVDGGSLREMIAEREVGAAQAIEIIRQIAGALAAAHEKGIVHRDIKPSNILIDKAGHAKIVDFGLSTVRGFDHLTRTGTTLGTLGYMSPEQVRGEKVDNRSDLFSLGVVLYEILTRRNPFRRDSEAATISAVSEVSPEPMARYKADLPPELQNIVDKLLNKDPSMRYQHAADIATDLRRTQTTKSVFVAERRRGKSVAKWLIPAASLLMAGVVVIVLVYSHRSRMGASSEVKRTKLTTVGNATICKPSPTNKEIAFIAKEGPAESRLMIQDLNSSSMIEIFHDVSISDFDWSPDGSRLVVTSVNASSLYSSIISRVGDNERTFSVWGMSVSWSPDGSTIAFVGPSTQIVFLQVATGDSSSVNVSGNIDYITDIRWLRDNQHLLIAETYDAGCRIQAIDREGQLGPVLADSILSPWFDVSSDDQWLYFLVGGGSTDLYRMRMNPSTSERVSDPVLVASGLSTEGPVSVSKDGKVLYYAMTSSRANLWKVTKSRSSSQPLITKQLTRGSQLEYWPAISPDGRSIAFARKSGDSVNIFTVTIDGDSLRRISFSGQANNHPLWSPSGKEIAYDQWDQAYSLMIAESNATLKLKLSSDSLGEESGLWAWSPGRRIAYAYDKSSKVGLFDPTTHATTNLISGDEQRDIFFALRYSPDGKVLAMAHTMLLPGEHGQQTRQSSVGLLNVADGTMKTLAAHGIDIELPIGWSSDGRFIIVETMNTQSQIFIERLSADGQARDTVFESPWTSITSPFAVANDTTFVCPVRQSFSDIWSLTGIDAAE